MKWMLAGLLLAACGDPVGGCYFGTGQNCGPDLFVTMAYLLPDGGRCEVTRTVRAEQYTYGVLPTYERPQPYVPATRCAPDVCIGGNVCEAWSPDGGFLIDCTRSGVVPRFCGVTMCGWTPPPAI